MEQDHIKEAWNSPYPTHPQEDVDRAWEEFKSTLPIEKERNYAQWGLVASMALLLCLSCYLALQYDPMVTVDNTAMADKEVWLPDGSLVLLKRDSEVRYRKKFEKERTVELRGEAFFDVARDSAREFKVKTVYTTTIALGTSFSVREALGSNDAEIALYTGRVLVAVKDIGKPWALVQGEKFVFQNGNGYVTDFDTDVHDGEDVSYQDMNNIELGEVYAFLEQKYGYRFISKPEIKNKRATLRINGQDSLNNVLKILSIINNVTYEVNLKTKTIQVREK